MVNIFQEFVMLCCIKNILKKIEKHEKKDVLTGHKILRLAKKRYLTIQSNLKPLRDILERKYVVKRIYLSQEAGDNQIVVEYLCDDVLGTIKLTQLAQDEFDILSNFGSYALRQELEEDDINRQKILAVFASCNDYIDDVSIRSTSKMVAMDIQSDGLAIKISLPHMKQSVEINYSLIDDTYDVKASSREILTLVESNLDTLLNNMRFYEEALPHKVKQLPIN